MRRFFCVLFFFCFKGSQSGTLSQRGLVFSLKEAGSGMVIPGYVLPGCSWLLEKCVQLKWEKLSSAVSKIIAGKGHCHTVLNLLKIGFLPGTLHVCAPRCDLWLIGGVLYLTMDSTQDIVHGHSFAPSW